MHVTHLVDRRDPSSRTTSAELSLDLLVPEPLARRFFRTQTYAPGRKWFDDRRPRPRDAPLQKDNGRLHTRVRVDVRARSRAAAGRAHAAAGRTRAGSGLSCGSIGTIGRIDLGVAPLGPLSRGPDEHECGPVPECGVTVAGRNGDRARRRLLMKWVLLTPDCAVFGLRVGNVVAACPSARTTASRPAAHNARSIRARFSGSFRR